MSGEDSRGGVTRYGMVIRIKPDRIEEYKRLHADAWPGVLATIRACGIVNYSIFLREVEPGCHLLFSYFEYTGGDFEADMEKMAADPVTQEWWKVCVPCVEPIGNAEDGELWSIMEEVFHCD